MITSRDQAFSGSRTLDDKTDEDGSTSEKKLDGFAQRLIEAIGDQSVSAFARKCGLGEGSLRKYLNGGRPSIDRAATMADAAGVSLSWLATGEGERSASKALQSTESNALPAGYIQLPKYDVQAALGDGVVVHDERIVDYLAFREDWIRRRLRRDPNHLVLIEAVGDSMDPTIKDGDLVLIDISTHDFRQDAIYAISVHDMLMIKRLQFTLRGAVVVRSDNERYDDEELGPADAQVLRVVGQVIWRGAPM